MKKWIESGLILGTILILSACDNQSDAETETPGSPLPIAVQKEHIYDGSGSGDTHYLREVERTDPVWAGISHSRHFGSINTDYIVEVTDQDTLRFIVKDMIEGSDRMPGIVDISEPYYGMKVEYEDGSTETFHLWITDDEDENAMGTLMDSQDTHYIYTFPLSVSAQFLSLLPEDAILDAPKYADWIEEDRFGTTQPIEPYVETDIEGIIDFSNLIVQGSFVSVEPSDVPASWGDESIVYYTFEVEAVLKGDTEEDRIEVGHPENMVFWMRDPETNRDLGTLKITSPFIATPDSDKDILLFLNQGTAKNEYWRFSEPTMLEVKPDGSLKSLAPVFDSEFDSTDRVVKEELSDDWTVEFTLDILSEDLPFTDPFEHMTLDELKDIIK